MPVSAPDDKTLRGYLLGSLPLERQEEVDSWIMSEDDAELLMTAAEDDLIDDSLAGRLTAGEQQRLTDHFLRTPERQHRFQFGRSFKRMLETYSAEPLPEPRAIERTAVRGFRLPFFAYAAAMVLVLIAGAVWSAQRTAELERRIAAADVAQQALQDRLDASQLSGNTLRTQIQAFALALSSASAAAVVELRPGLLRSPGEVPTILVSANTPAVRLALFVQDQARFSSYRASLIGADGQEIAADLPATPASGTANLIVALPAALLPAGGYSLNISGISAATAVPLGSYYFSIQK